MQESTEGGLYYINGYPEKACYIHCLFKANRSNLFLCRNQLKVDCII